MPMPPTPSTRSTRYFPARISPSRTAVVMEAFADERRDRSPYAGSSTPKSPHNFARVRQAVNEESRPRALAIGEGGSTPLSYINAYINAYIDADMWARGASDRKSATVADSLRNRRTRWAYAKA